MTDELVDESLVATADNFATELNSTLEDVLGTSYEPYLRSRAVGHHVEISTTDPQGILLYVNEAPVYRLRVTLRCLWNSTLRNLAVQESQYQIAVDNFPEPVLRFDFLREPRNVPSSHVNIHSHHPGLQQAMESAKPSSRAKRARKETSKLHIPTGGARFRPSLEDVLEMLIREFGIDKLSDTWSQSLKAGRQNFRDTQLAAALKDNPKEAVRALSELGYTVSWDYADQTQPSPRDLKRRAY